MKYKKSNNKLLLISAMLLSSLLSYNNAIANECKIKVSYSNNLFNTRVTGSNNFVIHHNSTQTTLRNHMRVIRNTGRHSLKIKYWDISGDHWKTIAPGSTKRVSGDLKKTECLGQAHSSSVVVQKKIRCKAGGGMDLAYNAHSRRVTVRFTRTRRGKPLSSLRQGECSLVGITSGVSKFCHSGVNDMIWKLNSRSINVISRQAPYAIKLKNGGTFTLSVRNISNGCINIR